MKDTLHVIAMNVIFVGGIAMFVLAGMWWIAGNVQMALGMGVMGLIAESNYYLHRQMMKKQQGS